MKRKTNNFWYGLLLIGIIISVPENTLIRLAGDAFSVSMMTALRYSVAALIGLPFVVNAVRKRRVKFRRIVYMVLWAIPLSLDPLISQQVVSMTNASFRAILSMLTPVVFVILSTIITRDKISRHKFIGFMMAVLGSMAMVVLPTFAGSGGANFGPVPVILMFVQAICVGIEMIVWRRENERGTPLVVILGTYYTVWAIIAITMVLLRGETWQLQNITLYNLLIVIYLGAIASIIYNAVFTGFYRRLGTASAATTHYFKKALTIIAPLIILGETISWPVACGALLIILGTMVAGRHEKMKHHYHRP